MLFKNSSSLRIGNLNTFFHKTYLSSIFGYQNIENILLLRKASMANILNEQLYDSRKYMHKISRGVLYSDDDTIVDNYKVYKYKDEKSKEENKFILGNKESHGNENNIIFEDGNPEISFFTNRENFKIARYTWKAKEEKPKAYVFALHGITTHLRNQYLNYYGRPEWANKNENTMKECSINQSSKLRNSCSQSNKDISKEKKEDCSISKDNISNKKQNNENNVNENVHSQNVTNKKDFTKSMDDNNVLLFTESDKDNDVYKNLYYCSKCGLSNYCNCGKRTLSYESSWIQTLNDNGYTFCGIDNQSHGLSEASRNERCFVEDFENFVADAVQALEIFVNEWKAKNELRPIIIMGASMGGCIAVKMFERIYEEKKEWRKYIKGLALISPMMSIEKQTSSLFNKLLIGLAYILKKIFPLYRFKDLGRNLKYPWVKLDNYIDPYHYHEQLKAGIALECLFGTYSCMKSKILKYIDESDIDIIVLQSKYDSIVDPIGTVNFVNKMVNIYNKKDEDYNSNNNESNNKNNDHLNKECHMKSNNNSNISETIKSGDDKNLISNQSNNLSNKTCKYEKDYVILSGMDLKDEDILWKACDHGHYKNYKRMKNSTKSDKKNEKDKNNYKHLSAHILNYGCHKLSCEPDNKVTSSIFIDWLNNIFS
ncbi:alpha/beta hydrolase,putative [Plasmodium sp. gorilla clade G2]|uniref:alpha/beta hydrolase,putative n=1 Tax=Plasmodium sp. gorilla clade G2 TaxID=880535 RepID=UPI000D2DDFDD|nr:alpha/beta hydrolase,putative [Plasmodium sp. gorilla clade G2]SOV20373.1 alpha/beta hydrolase,putative [Plasmodium sp. gorilla clade G2]